MIVRPSYCTTHRQHMKGKCLYGNKIEKTEETREVMQYVILTTVLQIKFSIHLWLLVSMQPGQTGTGIWVEPEM